MVLQLEDCTYVFKVLHPQFDIVFELDHSSGHKKEMGRRLDDAVDARLGTWGAESNEA
jgi:hypothetical protein